MHTYTFFGRPFQTLPMQCTVQLWSHISTTHTRQTSADLYCCVPKFILCKIYCDANFLISANYLKRIESIYQNKVGKKKYLIYILFFQLILQAGINHFDINADFLKYYYSGLILNSQKGGIRRKNCFDKL